MTVYLLLVRIRTLQFQSLWKSFQGLISRPRVKSWDAAVSGKHTNQAEALSRSGQKLRSNKHLRVKKGIIVTELPYQVNKAKLIEKIADLVRDKKIEGITDLRDESDRTGMRIVIEIRRDANANVILNNLYKQTALQTSFWHQPACAC
ncbi:DNA gyrase subunit A [Bacillus subtilis]|nr:DNA gyrase subunit A [Bacillus subtilis]